MTRGRVAPGSPGQVNFYIKELLLDSFLAINSCPGRLGFYLAITNKEGLRCNFTTSLPLHFLPISMLRTVPSSPQHPQQSTSPHCPSPWCSSKPHILSLPHLDSSPKTRIESMAALIQSQITAHKGTQRSEVIPVSQQHYRHTRVPTYGNAE